MTANRLWYLAALLGAGAYYIASGQWISFLLLVAVLALPWLSLLLSLPAILNFHASPAGLDIIPMGEEAELWLLGSCFRPMPPFRGKIRMQTCITGEVRRYNAEQGLPTEHCGGIVATAEKMRVCDYLGIFAFPVKKLRSKTIRIRPTPLAVPDPPDIGAFLPRRWKPKPGGGFSESHEIRLYRPGDSLNQVHWKLSAKTGKLMLREPMDPIRGDVLLTMTLRGTPEELDRKFGRLEWMSNHLLDLEVPHILRVLTADGILSFPVSIPQDLYRAIDRLLCTRAAESSIREHSFSASWQYHIGGDPDEV